MRRSPRKRVSLSHSNFRNDSLTSLIMLECVPPPSSPMVLQIEAGGRCTIEVVWSRSFNQGYAVETRRAFGAAVLCRSLIIVMTVSFRSDTITRASLQVASPEKECSSRMSLIRDMLAHFLFKVNRMLPLTSRPYHDQDFLVSGAERDR